MSTLVYVTYTPKTIWFRMSHSPSCILAPSSDEFPKQISWSIWFGLVWVGSYSLREDLLASVPLPLPKVDTGRLVEAGVCLTLRGGSNLMTLPSVGTLSSTLYWAPAPSGRLEGNWGQLSLSYPSMSPLDSRR